MFLNVLICTQMNQLATIILLVILDILHQMVANKIVLLFVLIRVVLQVIVNTMLQPVFVLEIVLLHFLLPLPLQVLIAILILLVFGISRMESVEIVVVVLKIPSLIVFISPNTLNTVFGQENLALKVVGRNILRQTVLSPMDLVNLSQISINVLIHVTSFCKSPPLIPP